MTAGGTPAARRTGQPGKLKQLLSSETGGLVESTTFVDCLKGRVLCKVIYVLLVVTPAGTGRLVLSCTHHD